MEPVLPEVEPYEHFYECYVGDIFLKINVTRPVVLEAVTVGISV